MYALIRTMKDFESTHALDMMRVTRHGRERYKERVPMLEKGNGKLVAGFLMDENGEAMEHFVTSVGIVFVRNHYTRKLVTVTVPSPSQISSYFEQAGEKVPKKLLDEAKDNKRIIRIKKREKQEKRKQRRATRY